MQQVQPIEGITPDGLWTTAGVLIGLAGIAIIVFKIIEFYWKAKDRKAKSKELDGKSLTDVIADKVMAKMTEKLDRIEGKLSADKERLDSHEKRLNEQERALGKLCEDTEQIMNVLDGMLMHFISGNDTETLKTVKLELDHYKNKR